MLIIGWGTLLQVNLDQEILTVLNILIAKSVTEVNSALTHDQWIAAVFPVEESW